MDIRKCFKVPTGYTEAVCRDKADNGMTRRKRTKGQAILYKTIHRQQKIGHDIGLGIVCRILQYFSYNIMVRFK